MGVRIFRSVPVRAREISVRLRESKVVENEDPVAFRRTRFASWKMLCRREIQPPDFLSRRGTRLSSVDSVLAYVNYIVNAATSLLRWLYGWIMNNSIYLILTSWKSPVGTLWLDSQASAIHVVDARRMASKQAEWETKTEGRSAITCLKKHMVL